MMTIFASIGVLGAVFSEDILYFWTQNQSLASRGGPFMQILTLGALFNGLSMAAYLRCIAQKNSILPIKINAILFVCVFVQIVYFSSIKFALGISYVWLFYNVSIFITYFVKLDFFDSNKQQLRLFFIEIILPLGTITLVHFSVYEVLEDLSYSGKFIILAMVAACSFMGARKYYVRRGVYFG